MLFGILNLKLYRRIFNPEKCEMPFQLEGQGVSLNSPQLAQRKEFMTEHLWQTPIIPPSEAIRTERWKYFRYINDPAREELYDLSVDPLEINNLASNPDFQTTLIELRKKMERMVEGYLEDKID